MELGQHINIFLLSYPIDYFIEVFEMNHFVLLVLGYFLDCSKDIPLGD